MVIDTDIKRLKDYLSNLSLDIKKYNDEYEYENPVLILVDAVLSINRNYNNFVVPRLELIKISGIDSFTKLEKELSKGEEYFMSFWNYKHIERVELLRDLLKYYKDFQKINNIQGDIETLKTWGKESSVENFKDWNVKGIAFTTYQYLRMLCGADTVKPDIHILRVVEEGMGKKLSPRDSVIAIENISKNMGVGARELDHAIWLYSSTRRINFR